MKNNFIKIVAFSLVSMVFVSCTKKDAGPIPQVIIHNADIQENHNGPAQVVLSLTERSDQTVSVVYSFNGTAVEGQDYTTSLPNPLIFNPGQTEVTLNIDIINDNETEGDEVIDILLTSASNATLKNDQAKVTIYDDEIVDEGYRGMDGHDGMTLVWQDEFEAASLNLADWTYEIGTGANGWGNNELQYYTEENAFLKQGFLVIEARKENKLGMEYTSSRIITKDKQSFKYGRIDLRARLPKGKGFWPALWMLGSNFSDVGWPNCGEIDIMEMIGGYEDDNVVYGTCHWDNGGNYASYGGNTSLTTGFFADEFHVFSISWDSNYIRWYLDDAQFHEIDITPAGLSEFQQSFFFIFNVAVGGNWPGEPSLLTRFPQRMVVDYVRVYQ